eukprot:jgi/Mesen1/5631/ME000282S04777
MAISQQSLALRISEVAFASTSGLNGYHSSSSQRMSRVQIATRCSSALDKSSLSKHALPDTATSATSTCGRRLSAICSASVAMPEAVPQEKRESSHEYNQMMKRAMKSPFEYHHDLGMYYTRITENLIVGSQPQSSEDIDRLFFDEGVAVVLNLQQDHDIQYWGININSIKHRCDQLGVRHYRRPARDFDPHSLRHELPRMVAVLDRHIREGRTVYVHCTAGLGRAPAAAIAYLFWFNDMDLGTAYHFVTSKRPCGPKKEAIRGATYDLAKNNHHQPPFEHLPDFAFGDVAPWERQLIQDRVRGAY